MVAASVVATLSAIALMTLSGDAAEAGTQAANRGLEHAIGTIQFRGPVIATRGDIDIDGNNIIDLTGSDIQAVATLKFVVSSDLSDNLDLTPPYTIDSTGVDPDFSTNQIGTVISVISENFSTSSAAWTVTFPGDDDGDNVLDSDERAEITVWLHPEDLANGWFDLGSGLSDPYVDASDEALVARDHVTLRITSDRRPQSSIARTLPLELTSSILLE